MKTVFVDVDTQLDFMVVSGALYVPLAERLAPTLVRLNGFALERGIPLLSTMDAHAENDAEFGRWPHHCVAGTLGQRKIGGTVGAGAVTLGTGRGQTIPAAAPQVLLEKQANDCFTNPNLLPLLMALDAERFVVYGVVTEICVQCAAFGLLKLGKRVELVTDAVQHLATGARDRMFRDFSSGGGRLVTAADVCR
jgi:nicotinamidase/pyrazinamidase